MEPDAKRFILHRTGDGKTKSFCMAELLPGDICPYLAHSIIPYILTFSGGGSFPWMETTDPHAVDAQCPNPGGAVVTRIKAAAADGWDIEVREVRGECPKEYKFGDTIRWPRDSSIPLMDLNVLLSWMLQLHCMPDAGRTPDFHSPLSKSSYVIEREGGGFSMAEVACPPVARFNLSLGYFTHRCRYHKWPRRERYDSSNWIPRGMCPELFHAAYPSCLAMLYGGGQAASSEILCPHMGKVKLQIKVEERKTVALRRAAMRGLQLLGKSTEIPLHRCFLDVVEADSDCPMGMKAGMRFEFNMGDLPQLCPAMFHNAYPLPAARMRGAAFPWPQLDGDRGVVQCPDNVSNITLIYREESDDV